ncbi:PBECR4 domain-containing protein [Lactobacillus sp. ESL0731]|uniref:PBECR4 domain-containing protein n=1 Tax=unclassified Lactobacillus TaxID=2620435 RepID=UPI0023F6206D|nr:MULTISPECIES: PBECR4 domain-containing protein [unclassified Lactobacillus]WEV51431.1 PBECR4 domain-containing protein [Lactobacillus sp. ESL0700]WEV62561.1 PBECR4 domain-containing protein [Lactobacillus sp. ESL0731]
MVVESETDLLISAAREYEKLLGKEIKMVLGRKGKSEIITLLFDSSDFYHLAGLHKLADIRDIYRGEATDIFDKIVSGRIDISNINRSVFFDNIIERLEILSQINDLFTKSNTIFKFRKLQTRNSKINWKYLVEFETVQGYSGYLFLTEYRNRPNNYVCMTDFKKHLDYSIGQIKMTLLQTKLIDSGTEIVIFQSPSYKDE